MKLTIGLVARGLEKSGFEITVSCKRGEPLREYSCCKLWTPECVMQPGYLYVIAAHEFPRARVAPKECGLVIVGAIDKNASSSQGLSERDIIEVLSESKRVSILNELIEVFNVYARFEEAVRDTVERAGTIQEVIRHVSPMFDNELIVISSDFALIAHSYERVKLYDLSGIEHPKDMSRVATEVSSFFANDTIYKNAEYLTGPFYYEPSVFSVRVLCINIFLKGEYASRLTLSETSHPISQDDEWLLVWLAKYIQLLAGQTASAEGLQKDTMGGILARVTSGETVKPSEYLRCQERRGWRIDDPLVFAVAEALGYESRERIAPHICNAINQRFEDVCAVEAEGRIAFLVNLKRYGDESQEFFMRFAEFQRENNLRVGLCPTFWNLQEAPSRYKQASMTLDILLASDSEIWRRSFSEYFFEVLGACNAADISRDCMIPEEIIRLRMHDCKHQSSYEETLACYLGNKMNAVKTAEELYVHRATLVYRLKRIAEIGRIDYNDADQLLKLAVSYKSFVM